MTFRDSDKLKQGQIVFALGSPLGLENTLTVGYVSATSRQLNPDRPMFYIHQNGKFLGEWKYGGQFYTVAFSTGEVYAATHPKGVSLDEEFNVVKIDLASGKILGKFGVRSHELAVAPNGTLLLATRSGQLVFLKPRH